MSAIAYLVLGIALGAGSSVVPGPCGLAVIDAATRRTLGRAIATGGGAAIGDATCAALGVLGLGPVLARHPEIAPALRAAGGVGLVVFGLASVLRARTPAPEPRPGDAARGVLTGLATMCANPASVLTWLLLVGSTLASASAVEAWSAAAGIGLGSFGWYTAIACVSRHARGAWIDRLRVVVSSLLVVVGVVSLSRTIGGW